MSEGTVDGYPRQVWWNADGETVVESYTITDMAHGTPLGIADNDERYGAAGRVPDRGGNFVVLSHREFLRPDRMDSPAQRSGEARRSEAAEAAKEAAKTVPAAFRLPARRAGSRRSAVAAGDAQPPCRAAAASRGVARIDVGAVITRALTAAGLMK